MRKFNQIDEIKRAHKGHWFDADAMRFFGTRILPTVYGGRYFITSEQPPHGPRAYAIREADEDGNIQTVGDVCQYPTADAARKVVKELLKDQEK